MSIDFPNSPSNGDTYSYSGETYRYNGVAWVRVRDRVTTFNGATGAIVGVTSVQGKTGDVTLTDLEITHGVETFNGLSGSIDTTLLTLPVAGLSASGGITFSDGTFQPTAARSGFRYTMVSSGSGLGTPSSGHMDIDKSGEIDTLIINHTDKEGNNLKPLFEKLRDNGGYLELMTGDFSQAAAIAIESQSGDDGIVSTGETTIAVSVSTATVQAAFDIEQGLDQQNITDVYLRIVPNAANFIREFNGITGSVDTSTLSLSVAGITASSGISCEGSILLAGDLSIAGDIIFADGTQQKTATKDVGTFTISASSAISTGAKADALHRIPYNATLTKFELKSKATGGMTAAVYIAGADFGNPTNAFITGATAETTGFTADTTTFGTATVSEGDFVYLHVLANASGATAAQAFVSYETR